MNIVTLCTGNVARSVMLGFMLEALSESAGVSWQVRSAGTHVVEGLAISGRTRDALRGVDELRDHDVGAHRSHQLDDTDVAWADVILASESDHVRFVRVNHRDHAHKVVQLRRFVRSAPLDESFAEQLAAVAAMEPTVEFDVVDPAGGDQSDYDECADQLWVLAQAFFVIVTDNG